MKTKVSIIVPNYNHAQFLQQRLDSIFNQSFQDFEVILLDDCSTDYSLQVLNKYKNHPKVSQFVVNKKNSGSPFVQWKKGINLAKGEFIWIAESDDYCELDFLEKLLKHKDKADILYCQSFDVNEKGIEIYDRINYTSNFFKNIWYSNFQLKGKQFLSDYLIIKNVIPNASAVIFKKKLIGKNIFSKELLQMKMCGDWFFWIKIIDNANVYFLNNYLNYFRNHENISRKHITIEMKRERLKEESLIRAFLCAQHGFKNKKADIFLLKRWFNLFSYREILSSEFYSIKQCYQSWLYFYYMYFKIKSRI